MKKKASILKAANGPERVVVRTKQIKKARPDGSDESVGIAGVSGVHGIVGGATSDIVGSSSIDSPQVCIACGREMKEDVSNACPECGAMLGRMTRPRERANIGLFLTLTTSAYALAAAGCMIFGLAGVVGAAGGVSTLGGAGLVALATCIALLVRWLVHRPEGYPQGRPLGELILVWIVMGIPAALLIAAVLMVIFVVVSLLLKITLDVSVPLNLAVLVGVLAGGAVVGVVAAVLVMVVRERRRANSVK